MRTTISRSPGTTRKLGAAVHNLTRLRAAELENHHLKVERSQARKNLEERHDLCGIIYRSAAMHEVVSLAVKVARADVPILITGANGTGKEKVAELIQRNSRRCDRPFVKVNTGALSETLLEAELFGAEAGAYTGANKRRVGRFEAAHKGSLLLDEIGNLSAAGQAKLLRVLESGQFERVGSSESQQVDVRILAATNADLRVAIQEGRFREDLFFRLNVIEIALPLLKDRRADILPLARHFLGDLGVRDGRIFRLTSGAQGALLEHDWPGNVRELRNCVQRASLICEGREIRTEDLRIRPGNRATGSARSATPRTTTKETIEEDEKAHGSDREERARVEEALLLNNGVIAKAAQQLGCSRQSLYRKMRRLGIVLERRPRSR